MTNGKEEILDEKEKIGDKVDPLAQSGVPGLFACYRHHKRRYLGAISVPKGKTESEKI